MASWCPTSGRWSALPTFVLGCALAALILPFVPEIDDNPGFDLCGRTSIGKSNLMRLAASVFGSRKALLRKWDTTVNALEPAMAAAGDGLLLLDELNLFLDSVSDAPRQLGNAIHKLSQGSEKDRLTSPTTTQTQTHRFVFLSTTNQPITDVVKVIGQDRTAAIAVRMPTIPADAGTGHGVLDSPGWLLGRCRGDPADHPAGRAALWLGRPRLQRPA